MSEYLYLFLYRSFTFLIDILPPSWLDKSIDLLARFAYFASAKRRHIIHANLRLCFPKMPENEMKTIGIHSYKNLLYNIASLVDKNKTSLLERVTFEGREVVDNAIKEGKNIIFITAHFGMWEVLSSAIALGFKKPFSVVGRELDSPLMQKELKIGREKIGVGLINKRGALKGMIKVLNKKEMLGLLIDQSLPASASVDVTFFGKKVTQTPSASILAHKFDALIIPIFITSKDFKHHTVTCHTPIMIDKTLPKEEDLKRLNQAQANIIETEIKKYPTEWFWSHKKFKVYNREIYA